MACQEPIEVRGRRGQAREVDVGDLVQDRVDDLDVDPGASGQAHAAVLDALAGEQLDEGLGVGAAEQAGRGDRQSRVGQEGGDIDPLAAGIGLLPLDPVDAAGGEVGHPGRLVDGRVQAQGDDALDLGWLLGMAAVSISAAAGRRRRCRRPGRVWPGRGPGPG